jgi:gliding motility-associated-like protein
MTNKRKNKVSMNLRSTVIRAMSMLFAILLIHAKASAQSPPNPTETDTLAPFITTANITVFNTSGAIMGGNVTGDGGAPVTERGIVYSSLNTIPTLGNSKVIVGSGTGVYSQNITGLTGGTVYYVRAYATNVVGTSYGTVVTVTTSPVPPLTTTSAIADITNNTATVGGTVTFDGGATVTERGIVWSSVITAPTVAETKIQMGAGTGVFSGTMSGLVLGTTYYVRGYAVNSAGTSYGAVFSFVPAGASVTSIAAVSVTTNSARLGGNITSIGGSPVTDRGVVYVAGAGVPTSADTKVSMGAGAGVFSQVVSGFADGSTYTVRAYATNSATTNYGDLQTFTTQTSISAITRDDAAISNKNVVSYTVTFAKPVTGVTAGNFSATGAVNASVSAVIGSGRTWTVSVYTGGKDSPLGLNLTNATGISPNISNTLPFTGEIYTVDKTPPSFSLVSVKSNNADTTLAKTGDLITLTLVTTETSTAPAVVMAGQTATITSTGTNKWTANYMLKATDTEGPLAFTVTGATDIAGNVSLTATATTNATSVRFDKTAPAVSSIARITASPSNAAAVQFNVTFTEPVLNVDAGDFSLTTTVLTGASITSITGAGAVYIVTANSGADNGTIRLDLQSSGTGVADRAGNNIANGGYASGERYVIAKNLGRPVVKTNDPAAICAPGTVDLTTQAVTAGSDAGLTYAYYTDAAATHPLNNPAAIAATGAYYIVGTNLLNNASDPVAVNVTITSFQNPKASFVYDTYCTNKAINFNNTSTAAGSGAVGYLWADNASHTASSANASFNYATAGSYSVKLKVFSQACPNFADSVTQLIPVVAPAAAIRITKIDARIDELLSLQARTFGQGTTYSWAPADGLSSPVVANPAARINTEKTYRISLTAPSGCVTVDTLQVRVFENFVYVPSLFSPNGDGINDILYINLVSINQLNYFRLVNRYGKKVFETSNAAQGWDGKLNGQLQPVDTYVWMMEGVNKNGTTVSMQGTVTLLR